MLEGYGGLSYPTDRSLAWTVGRVGGVLRLEELPEPGPLLAVLLGVACRIGSDTGGQTPFADQSRKESAVRHLQLLPQGTNLLEDFELGQIVERGESPELMGVKR